MNRFSLMMFFLFMPIIIITHFLVTLITLFVIHSLIIGNIDGIRQLITTHFDDNCLFRTVVMEKSTRGRQHIMAMYEGTMLTHPDLCVIPKSIRVVRELPMAVIGAPLTGGSTSSSGASSSSSGISRSSSGATTSCSSGSDGDDEKMNSADTLCPEMTEEELKGLPRCVLYKYFFTGALQLPFPLIAYTLSSTHTRTTSYTYFQYPHILKQIFSYNTNK